MIFIYNDVIFIYVILPTYQLLILDLPFHIHQERNLKIVFIINCKFIINVK